MLWHCSNIINNLCLIACKGEKSNEELNKLVSQFFH